MRLYFLRHADADAASRLSDSERVLSSSGIAEAASVAEAVAELGLTMTEIFASPFARAMQTAEIVAKRFPSLRVQALEHLTPNAPPENFFRELQSLPRDARVLLVTHEPFVSRCIGMLISADGEPKVSIKKASLSCVEVGSPVRRGAGVLLWILTNDQMKHMKG